MKRSFAVALLMAALAATALAAVEPYPFSDPGREARFRALLLELRCLVCQNQTLSDSDADLAQDLRQQVYEMINQGRSDSEIVDYMVARYGDFVLYRPPVKTTTYALWVGPFLLFATGVWVLVRMVKRRAGAAPASASAATSSTTHLESEAGEESS
jgi:cytochrome c-type biogenesis protein CcmH